MIADWYRVLQVDAAAEPEVVAAAYRALSRKYHPDVNPGPTAAERQRELNAAFAILGDLDLRAQYDRTLGRDWGQEVRARPLEDWRWLDGRRYVHNSSLADLLSGGTMHALALGSTFTACGWDAASWRKVQSEEEFWAGRPCGACVRSERKAS